MSAPGKKNGQVIMVRAPDGTVEAHSVRYVADSDASTPADIWFGPVGIVVKRRQFVD